ncbi:polynucleotide adenylyltransferase [Spirochaetia bacterium]|nr:polynucleotide adenylyltransferase [Spirochaetia bacterium]
MRIRYSAEKNGRPIKKAIVYTHDEHGIKFSDVDRDAVIITERLRSAGYETYIVGGAVRDLILGKKPKDFDIVSSANPTRIKKLFRNARIIGHRFRLVHVHAGPKIFEVSTFRSLKDGPTSNTFGTIEEDVLRRDFSLNALFYDPGKQIVIDYVDGMKDIREKRIRPIIPLATIFTDDPVRMIRAVKYGATTGFKLPLALRWKIKKQSSLLASVSPSRLTEEIFKIINSSSAALIVEKLEDLKLYEYLQPNASRLMKENPGFCGRYLDRLSKLNQGGPAGPAHPASSNKPGQKLAAFIQDFLELQVQFPEGNNTADWEGAKTTEHYKNAYIAVRAFVLPMNPPRVELDHAVRLIFADHGITVKHFRLPMHGSRARAGAAGESPDRERPVQAGPAPAAGEAPKKRRRRRRHKAPGQSENPLPETGE